MSNRWHSWFAWYPVYVEDGEDAYFVWWEHVVRRRVYLDGRYVWQYRLHEGGAYS